MKTTPEQDALLAEFHTAYLDYKTFAIRRRRHYDEKLREDKIREEYALDMKVRELLAAGVNAATITQRGYGVKNPHKVPAALKRTEELNADLSRATLTPASITRYSYDEGAGALTIAPALLELAALNPEGHGFTLEALREHGDLVTASFTVEGTALNPLTPDWLDEHQDRHPVMVWLTPERERAALDWFSAQKGQA